MDRNEAIQRIKTALRRRSGKAWSVTGGRGTAWGWINIDAPPARRTWQHIQTRRPEPPAPGAVYAGALGLTPPYRVGPMAEDQILSPDADPWAREAAEAGREVLYCWEVCAPGKPFGHMAPSERAELSALLGLNRPVHFQGQSVAASSDYRREYVDRAEGREPAVYGERYWD